MRSHFSSVARAFAFQPRGHHHQLRFPSAYADIARPTQLIVAMQNPSFEFCTKLFLHSHGVYCSLVLYFPLLSIFLYSFSCTSSDSLVGLDILYCPKFSEASPISAGRGNSPSNFRIQVSCINGGRIQVSSATFIPTDFLLLFSLLIPLFHFRCFSTSLHTLCTTI